MAIVTGDRYLETLQKFLEEKADLLIDGTDVLKLNPAGLHYVHLRLESLRELELMLSGAPVDYLRAYVSDIGDFRALEQLRRILRLIPSLKVVSSLPSPARDPTPLSLLPFSKLKVLELRGCDLSTSSAKGLLELRHTLEKLICHNSTDALRHVFASRIAEIKDSPQWNKLAFISCACNRLVLMDESLQLLPAVESLDLSRNKFAKVDNLRRCTKLKHLDLGFNQLRKISHLSEVSCHLVKLVLRNNALTTLRGIENLKSLEGLDVSFNLISDFSELEFLGSLSFLTDLWLEGNPICCARWYRAHVLSYVSLPNDLKLDGKHIGNREFWKRQVVVTRRKSQPASYGFYSPARDEADDEGSCNRKKTKIYRLASIDSEEESTYVNSDQESASCEPETQSKEENIKSDHEADVFGLISKVEQLKKERSVLWLREFKEWIDHPSEDFVDVSKNGSSTDSEQKYYTKNRNGPKHHGETMRYAPWPLPGFQITDLNQKHQAFFLDGKPDENGNMSTLDATQDMTGSFSPSSPPHYQKDVLHRRQNLVEEILQISADSYSVASSDSSCSENENYDSEQSNPEQDTLKDHLSGNRGEDTSLLDSQPEKRSIIKSWRIDDSFKAKTTNFLSGLHNSELASGVNQIYRWFDKRKSKRKPKKRDVSPLEENSCINNGEPSHRSDADIIDSCEDEYISDHFQEGSLNTGCNSKRSTRFLETEKSLEGMDGLVEEFFTTTLSDSSIDETCRIYVSCDCIIQQESTYKQREVVLLLSSQEKLYVLLVGVSSDSQESNLSLLCSHTIGDIQDVSVGLGLQVVRLRFREDAEYIFITASIEKTTVLLNIIKLLDSQVTESKCSLKSLENVQVELFEKEICSGLKLSIFQYNVLHFQSSTLGEVSWLPRSLFVAGGRLFICNEDFRQLSFLPTDASSSPYFSLASSCSISDIFEMVVESRGSSCLSLKIKQKDSTFQSRQKRTVNSVTWKLKLLSNECVLKFVALVNGLHPDSTECPLLVRHLG
ncbi:Leucine-rich repeat [Arabidopsis thaliana x Arabidopsis arenosa]|uniref:Leucine-rich repeat n=1 Tax=Arabidopsis thaliana x Arabidopsis arenosa TaxID=1240361 RepID=A0A8T2AVP4_9BRAS|nr:Leucine-rich repeat [Arabidopsis thaliana x Arabidopsis arenosa]